MEKQRTNIKVRDTDDGGRIYEFADYKEMALELAKWLNLEVLD